MLNVIKTTQYMVRTVAKVLKTVVVHICHKQLDNPTRNYFSSFLKVQNDLEVERRAGNRLFYARGPAMANARSPVNYVVSFLCVTLLRRVLITLEISGNLLRHLENSGTLNVLGGWIFFQVQSDLSPKKAEADRKHGRNMPKWLLRWLLTSVRFTTW